MDTHPVPPDQVERLLEAVHALRACDPNFLPPIRKPFLAELRGENAFGQYGAVQPFLCDEAGEPLGTAAAFLNPRLVDESGAPVGMIGAFECRDNPAAARQLITAASEWLRARGCREILAPMNGGAHRAHRFMTRGFERSPFLFEPRNPSYYPGLFESAGFAVCNRWHSYDLPNQTLGALHQLLAAAAASVHEAGRFRIDLHDAGMPAATIPRLHAFLDELWTGHTGYAALEVEEFAEVFSPLIALVTDRHLGFLVDQAGHDAGIAFMYPDYYDAVKSLQGDGSRWLEVPAATRPKRLILHTVAVHEHARRTGATRILIDRGLQNLIEDGFEEALVALVTEDWKLFRNALPPTREYALMRRTVL
ncbi:MAG: hypothetical protein ACYS22_14075 [Planctomycetota bacterium]